jgi:hypothetical protein
MPGDIDARIERRDPGDGALLTGGSEPGSRPGPAAVPGLVEHYFRHEYGRLVAMLTRMAGVRHVEIVEECERPAKRSKCPGKFLRSSLVSIPGPWSGGSRVVARSRQGPGGAARAGDARSGRTAPQPVVERAAGSLSEFPERGAVVRELENPNCASSLVGRYRLTASRRAAWGSSASSMAQATSGKPGESDQPEPTPRNWTALPLPQANPSQGRVSRP